ncbi:hypothetical protein B0H34DRAFT_799037 [Crassisporium funariophilum]|nr:hypothetical protein B0H34DRAFT_799037 [Crassisporium funariophilum]
MAFQTLTSALEPPASTSSSSGSGSSSSGGGLGSAFSPAGSPPLILAFLAIGLFSAAMIIVFGWRRIQFGRGGFTLGVPRHGGGGEYAMGRVLPQRPRLWDLWNGGGGVSWQQLAGKGHGHGKMGTLQKPSQHKSELDVRWKNIMPLSAKAVSALGQVAEDSKAPAPVPPLLQFPGWPPSLRWKTSKSSRPHESTSTTPVTMQVAIAILMPSPRYPIYVRNCTTEDKYDKYLENGAEVGGGGRDSSRNEITDYSIGLYECSWHQ